MGPVKTHGVLTHAKKALGVGGRGTRLQLFPVMGWSHQVNEAAAVVGPLHRWETEALGAQGTCPGPAS